MEQIGLFGTAEEAALYHDPGRYGYFSLLSRGAGADQGKMNSDSYKLVDLPFVLNNLDRSLNTWISQCEFERPNRRVVNLLRMGLLFADFDCYNTTALNDAPPERMLDALLLECEVQGIPPPSIVIYSGRGLQSKWLLEHPLPRQALPRWNACQRSLVDKLIAVGADPAAKDASRVLRLVDTVNTKSGQFCRAIHITPGLDGLPIRYGFDFLAEWLLPYSREQIAEKRLARAAQREARIATRVAIQKARGEGEKPEPGTCKFSLTSLNWSRLEDLRRLVQLRTADGPLPEGQRMLFLFWCLNFLLLSKAVGSQQMYFEALALAREIDPGWTYDQSALSTLYSKARQMEAGESVSFGGRDYSPLYTPTSNYLIQVLKITQDEQRQLSTIIGQEVQRERARERQERIRREAGAVQRAIYLDAALTKREQAHALRARGLSIRAIAAEMSASKSAVGRYLSS